MIADKAPELRSAPNLSHQQMAIQNLLGGPVAMDGRMKVSEKCFQARGNLAVINAPSPEDEALHRWRLREFVDVERRFAKRWRDSIQSIDLQAVAAGVKALGKGAICNTLDKAKEVADEVIARSAVPDLIKLVCLVLSADPKVEPVATERWRASGGQPFVAFAPYAAHILTVEVFFQLALGGGLVSPEPNSRTDIIYFYYVPFCNVFVSSDRLHRRCSPFFLRSDQCFVWGQELKADLKKLVGRYLALPEDVKEKGVISFARTPPPDDMDCLVGNLWDRFGGKSWRDPRREISKEMQQALMDIMKKYADAPESEFPADLSKVGMIQVNRRVNARKGSFYQVPKGSKNQQS